MSMTRLTVSSIIPNQWSVLGIRWLAGRVLGAFKTRLQHMRHVTYYGSQV
jgi:hypothetical protein